MRKGVSPETGTGLAAVIAARHGLPAETRAEIIEAVARATVTPRR